MSDVLEETLPLTAGGDVKCLYRARRGRMLCSVRSPGLRQSRPHSSSLPRSPSPFAMVRVFTKLGYPPSMGSGVLPPIWHRPGCTESSARMPPRHSPARFQSCRSRHRSRRLGRLRQSSSSRGSSAVSWRRCTYRGMQPSRSLFGRSRLGSRMRWVFFPAWWSPVRPTTACYFCAY